ncbi:MerR family transcriptional regulator [Pseudonocardia sp. KRD-184]|uniref:MerR family transcriptional regulator n=1 Tax=Pseudonocardia oceani TaxID=2792013 RepID=A0ABS6U6T1_9PSEU|nr:MerR family transcriptional regulator [Pseudonocardia oceani]MBW0089788.1 MerR family transcriptional regulator [Pseudonocardia oceani]MBW0095402.1 MerR family transcriptional regulator [Pseudonocardia oceani]MBW0108815.1 MerR family transcriptional regulator [Pseudonocardia oceani]MBW0122216.1 MerR family transcriptional regulator [Pseudonocardia oceani]MBW0127926.1 MerR family transcriptional regulator [Pseudonocardia oceani]
MQSEPPAAAAAAAGPRPVDPSTESSSAGAPSDGSTSDEPAPDSVPGLTVAAVARRLGIAPATLRTWDRRYGIGPGHHEPGRHRRYTVDDVARLELMQHALLRGAAPADAAAYARGARLPRPDADGPRRLLPPAHPAPDAAGDGYPARDEVRAGDDGATGGPLLLTDDAGDGRAATRVRVGGRALRLPGAGREARGLGRAALALDAGAIRRLLEESTRAHGVDHTWDAVARPVLAAVGQRWADTGAGVEIEHLVSECVTSVFAGCVAQAPAPRNPRPVLLAGMPGEQHTLPLAALAASLADRLVECRSLGSNLPADALVAAIRRTAPAAVVLWSQIPATADPALLRALPRTRPRFRTYAAGPGWAGVELPPRVGSFDSLADAAAGLAAAVLV